jgi:hypothetical protein
VESIPEFRLTPQLLDRFETLVLPEVECLSDAHAEMIRQWVEKGGTLVGTFRCGLRDEKHRERSNFALADVFGVDYAEEVKKYAYTQEGKLRERFTAIYLESSGHPLAQVFGRGTAGLPGSFLRVHKTSGVEILRYRLPWMVEDLPNNHWYNWGPPPPGEETAGPAVTLNRFGTGQAVYMGVALFRAMSNWVATPMSKQPCWMRDWLPPLLRQLVPNPIVELRPEPESEYIHGTFSYDPSKKFVLVQVLNTIQVATGGEMRRAPEVRISAHPEKLNVVGARVVWPKAQTLPIETRGGRTHVIIPSVEPYTALYLKLA